MVVKSTPTSAALGAALAIGLGCPSSPQDPSASTTSTTNTTASVTEAPLDSSGSASTGAAACAGLSGEGFAVGEISPSWTLTDANGAPVDLHDYCGKVIYIESGAEW